jgi:hypothetical protein
VFVKRRYTKHSEKKIGEIEREKYVNVIKVQNTRGKEIGIMLVLVRRRITKHG